MSGVLPYRHFENRFFPAGSAINGRIDNKEEYEKLQKLTILLFPNQNDRKMPAAGDIEYRFLADVIDSGEINKDKPEYLAKRLELIQRALAFKGSIADEKIVKDFLAEVAVANSIAVSDISNVLLPQLKFQIAQKLPMLLNSLGRSLGYTASLSYLHMMLQDAKEPLVTTNAKREMVIGKPIYELVGIKDVALIDAAIKKVTEYRSLDPQTFDTILRIANYFSGKYPEGSIQKDEAAKFNAAVKKITGMDIAMLLQELAKIKA